MGASYGKLLPEHEEEIYRLRKAGKTGKQMREALALGGVGFPPVSVSLDRCLKVARRLLDERDELFNSQIQTMPAPEGLRVLTRRLMLIAEREVSRLERMEKRGKLDAGKLSKTVVAVARLHDLLARSEGSGAGAEPEPPDNGKPQPSSFASSLTGEQSKPAPAVPSPPVADRVL